MANLSIEWTKHLKALEEKENFTKLVVNSTQVLGRLKKILEDRHESSLKTDVADYSNASWAYRQAHLNGKREALQDLLKLLSFME